LPVSKAEGVIEFVDLTSIRALSHAPRSCLSLPDFARPVAACRLRLRDESEPQVW